MHMQSGNIIVDYRLIKLVYDSKYKENSHL